MLRCGDPFMRQLLRAGNGGFLSPFIEMRC
jgi:hypothetical protein